MKKPLHVETIAQSPENAALLWIGTEAVHASSTFSKPSQKGKIMKLLLFRVMIMCNALLFLSPLAHAEPSQITTAPLSEENVRLHQYREVLRQEKRLLSYNNQVDRKKRGSSKPTETSDHGTGTHPVAGEG